MANKLASKDEALKMAQEVLNLYCEQLNSTFANDALKAIDKALEQPAQEPVAIVKVLDGYDIQVHWLNLPPSTGLLYTHPHQWQGLTDDEIVKEIERTDEYMGKSFFAGVRWAEQALKEKNHD